MAKVGGSIWMNGHMGYISALGVKYVVGIRNTTMKMHIFEVEF